MSTILAGALWAIASLLTGGRDPLQAIEALPADQVHAVFRLDSGLVLPYPLDNLMRGFTRCAGHGPHDALDMGGVGPDHGVGTPIRAMAKARVIAFATPLTDPERCGAPLKTGTTARRGGRDLPIAKDIPGYGKVWFFTASYGAHRSGGFIKLKLLDGPLADHVTKYLHIATVRPDLKVGDVVEAGDEVALMGGTAVQDSGPHVHVQIETPRGVSLDPGPLFGVGSTRVDCKWGNSIKNPVRAAYSKAAVAVMKQLRSDARATREPAAACGAWTVEGDFAAALGGGPPARNGRAPRVTIPLPAGSAELGVPWVVSFTRLDARGRWQPRIQITDVRGGALFTGTQPAKGINKKRWRFASKHSGRRGVTAAVEMTAHVDVPLAVVLAPWPGVAPKHLRQARWRLEITRPCAAAAETPATPR